MNKLVSCLNLSLAVAYLVGCGAEHVTAIDEYWIKVSEGEPIPGDSWGMCDLDWTCSNPEGTCAGWVEPGLCEGDGCEAERFLIGCIHACDNVSDCPSPQSGEASVACVDGLCYLSCGAGSTCPSGYDCVARASIGGTDTTSLHVCMQVYSRADNG